MPFRMNEVHSRYRDIGTSVRNITTITVCRCSIKKRSCASLMSEGSGINCPSFPASPYRKSLRNIFTSHSSPVSAIPIGENCNNFYKLHYDVILTPWQLYCNITDLLTGHRGWDDHSGVSGVKVILEFEQWTSTNRFGRGPTNTQKKKTYKWLE